MPGVTIKIDIRDKEVHDLLKQAVSRVRDMKPVMTEIGEIVRASVVKNFRSGGRPESWEKSKRVKAAGGQTLLDKGRLRNSFTVDASANEVAVGTNVEYAAVHHFGAKKGSFGTVDAAVKTHTRIISQAFGRRLETPRTVTVGAHTRRMKLPWGDIPARPFMVIQEEDWVEIKKSLVRFLEGGN